MELDVNTVKMLACTRGTKAFHVERVTEVNRKFLLPTVAYLSVSELGAEAAAKALQAGKDVTVPLDFEDTEVTPLDLIIEDVSELQKAKNKAISTLRRQVDMELVNLSYLELFEYNTIEMELRVAGYTVTNDNIGSITSKILSSGDKSLADKISKYVELRGKLAGHIATFNKISGFISSIEECYSMEELKLLLETI